MPWGDMLCLLDTLRGRHKTVQLRGIDTWNADVGLQQALYLLEVDKLINGVVGHGPDTQSRLQGEPVTDLLVEGW